jgi:hypothetical protein
MTSRPVLARRGNPACTGYRTREVRLEGPVGNLLDPTGCGY